jgi:hypothetical protein
MVINIHDNNVLATRNKENLEKLWEEMNKFKDHTLEWINSGL